MQHPWSLQRLGTASSTSQCSEGLRTFGFSRSLAAACCRKVLSLSLRGKAAGSFFLFLGIGQRSSGRTSHRATVPLWLCSRMLFKEMCWKETDKSQQRSTESCRDEDVAVCLQCPQCHMCQMCLGVFGFVRFGLGRSTLCQGQRRRPPIGEDQRLRYWELGTKLQAFGLSTVPDLQRLPCKWISQPNKLLAQRERDARDARGVQGACRACRCPLGDRCTLAHSKGEISYHPAKYKTRVCNGARPALHSFARRFASRCIHLALCFFASGADCQKATCCFAHLDKESRAELTDLDGGLVARFDSFGCSFFRARCQRLHYSQGERNLVQLECIVHVHVDVDACSTTARASIDAAMLAKAIKSRFKF